MNGLKYDGNQEFHRQQLAAELQQLFRNTGFEFTERPNTNEEIYARPVPEVRGVEILVYSTIQAGETRDVGSDAIRVTVVYTRKDGTQVQLFKTKPVHRTGQFKDITTRVHERMREGYKTLRTRTLEGKVCRHCGAPTFISKAGKDVCAEICWQK